MARRMIFRNLRSVYDPIEINAGEIDAVHARTLDAMSRQMTVTAPKQYSTMLFGLPDLSPYAVDARVNPVKVHPPKTGF